ncbi:unnamed protein product [Pylaiella littoralis]
MDGGGVGSGRVAMCSCVLSWLWIFRIPSRYRFGWWRRWQWACGNVFVRAIMALDFSYPKSVPPIVWCSAVSKDAILVGCGVGVGAGVGCVGVWSRCWQWRVAVCSFVLSELAIFFIPSQYRQSLSSSLFIDHGSGSDFSFRSTATTPECEALCSSQCPVSSKEDPIDSLSCFGMEGVSKTGVSRFACFSLIFGDANNGFRTTT